jgi:O-antigen ligase
LVLTLVLEIYPSGLSPEIALFLALAGVAGVLGLLHRSARRELLVLTPWCAALLLAMLVGAFRNGESLQAVEDSVPYLLFMLGLFAGRGASKSRAILVVLLWVCVIDSFVSLYKMPSYSSEMRSTYNYWKITAGLPLVGMFASSMLRSTDPKGRSPSRLGRPLHSAVYLLMLVAVVMSVSRGMMLGWVLGVAVATYVRRPSQTLMLGIVGVILLVGYSSVFSELGARYLRTGQSSTIEGRFREIEAAWLAFTVHPLFGDGLGAMFEVDGFYKAFVSI